MKCVPVARKVPTQTLGLGGSARSRSWRARALRSTVASGPLCDRQTATAASPELPALWGHVEAHERLAGPGQPLTKTLAYPPARGYGAGGDAALLA
jgi:hypothetical protein